jgi:hypothetical protein
MLCCASARRLATGSIDPQALLVRSLPLPVLTLLKTKPPQAEKDGTVAITVSPFDGANRIRFKGSPDGLSVPIGRDSPETYLIVNSI